MAIEIHIRRTPPIGLNEWKSILVATKNARLFNGQYVAVNPKTGVRITMDAMDGDAEVCIDGDWRPCFRWTDGSIAIKASAFDSVVSEMVHALATNLGAKVVDDDGQEI